MHQALYRKWRPRTFDDVCGQEHITSVLRYEVAAGTPSHAYLFCGSRGTGKTTCAKILARAVNCENPQNGNPCGKCAACLTIERGSATDVLEMDAASNNGVENIRDIREEVIYSPASLRYRVYIVDEAHMLSASAFNALLKTLEEPPAHVIFILATTELQKLPATIVSRCQRFDFRRIATPVLADRVTYIAKEEKIGLLPEAALRIARLAQGGMRDAISLLELCAGAGRTIDLATVDEMTGSVGRTRLIALADAISRADCDAVLSEVADAVASARDLSVFFGDLLSLYRDLLVMKTAQNAARYLDLTDSEAEELSALCTRFGRGQLLSHCRALEDGLLSMSKVGAVKRTVAELTLLTLCDPTLDTSLPTLLSRVEKLEEAVATGKLPDRAPADEKKTEAKARKSEPVRGDKAEIPGSSAPSGRETPGSSAPKEKETPAPDRAAADNPKAPVTPAAPAPQKIRNFPEAISRLGRANPMLAPFLTGARAYLTTGGVRVVLRNDFSLMMLEKSGGRDELRRALSVTLSREVPDRALTLEVAAPNEETETDQAFDDLLSAAGSANNDKGETK
ncbi:MAG: DNA polymerase III subunit gamma/tau [Eubacteriales bacterium]|nr:DNA polymerase III subunit gamma/tau [Eubacteriales bacterium]